MTLQEMMEDEFEEGKKQGTDRHLIEQICKKLSKGKDTEKIADEVEEGLDVVQVICDAASAFAPDYDVDAIYNALKAKDKLPV